MASVVVRGSAGGTVPAGGWKGRVTPETAVTLTLPGVLGTRCDDDLSRRIQPLRCDDDLFRRIQPLRLDHRVGRAHHELIGKLFENPVRLGEINASSATQILAEGAGAVGKVFFIGRPQHNPLGRTTIILTIDG